MLSNLLMILALAPLAPGDAPETPPSPKWSENPAFLALTEDEQASFVRELVAELMADGRELEALPFSAHLMRQALEDPSVAGPFQAIEASIHADLEAGRIDRAVDRFDLYRAALIGDPLLSLLARRLGAEVASELAGAAEESRRAGDRGRAIELYETALLFEPESQLAADGLHWLINPPANPGARDTWESPVDRKTMVWIPSGRFIMGCTEGDTDCQADERHIQRRTVRGFWMDVTEVTNEEYLRCVEAGACSSPNDETHRLPDRARQPVTSVSWDQARQYATWAGKRLPSETEWEFAARGPVEDSRYPWGNDFSRRWANASGRGGTDEWSGVAPVGRFPRTSFGLYDIVGNVWEWCEDSYHENIQSCPTDGSPCPETGSARVLRGGSAFESPESLRVSRRFRDEPSRFNADVGFRCAMDGE